MPATTPHPQIRSYERLFVGGQWRDGTGERIDVVSPHTEEVIAHAAGGSAADVDFAWAITVHKSQGSEWPCVVIVADDAASQIADANWWYTAISRSKKLCVIIGPKGVFDKQIRRRAIDKRRTFLTELITSNEESK